MVLVSSSGSVSICMVNYRLEVVYIRSEVLVIGVMKLLVCGVCSGKWGGGNDIWCFG